MRKVSVDILVLSLCIFTVHAAQHAQLYWGGPIYPMTSAPWEVGIGPNTTDSNRVSVLGVQDGRIRYVGNEIEEARAMLGENVSEIDLDGQAMLPAFIDGHSHIAMMAEQLLDWVDLSPPKMGGNVSNIPQLIAALKSRKIELGMWHVGFGYDQSCLAERRHPTRHDLDKVSNHTPVFILHASLHGGVANTAALAAAHLLGPYLHPAVWGCELERDEFGDLTGRFIEMQCMLFFEPVLPRYSLSRRIEQMEAASQHYVSRGYATAQNGYSFPDMNRVLEATAKAGRLHCRVVVLPGAELYKFFIIAGMKKDRVLNVSVDPSRLVLGPAKFVLDGSVSLRTAYLLNEYDPQSSGEAENYCASPHMNTVALTKSMRIFHRAGYRLAVHANGDAAVDSVLSALETLASEENHVPEMPVIIHSEFTHRDQLDRMVTLGASPSFFNLHVFYWWQQWEQWARAPADEITPVKDAIERHLVYSLHTDSPVVRLDPMRVMWSAVTRRRGDDDGNAGAVFGASQRVDIYAALWGLTAGSAKQWQLEDDIGSLRPGLRADLVVLDRDPFALKDRPDELLQVKVTATIVNGDPAYTTPTQPLVGLQRRDYTQKQHEVLPDDEWFSSSWVSDPHGEGLVQAAIRIQNQSSHPDVDSKGSCAGRQQQRSRRMSKWLMGGVGLVLAVGTMSAMVYAVRSGIGSQKQCVPQDLSISLQTLDEAA